MNQFTIPTINLVRGPCPQSLPSESDLDAEVWCDPQGVTQAIGHTVAGEHWFHVLGLASYHLNAQTDTVIAYVVRGVFEEDVIERYCRTALPLALQVRGFGVLHASSVLSQAGVIGFCAASTTGKSTLAYALSKRGYRVWGDDVLSFQGDTGKYLSFPLPFRTRLRPATADHYQLPLNEHLLRWETARHQGASKPRALAALIVLERENKAGGKIGLEQLTVTDAYNALLEHAFTFTLEDVELRRTLMQSYLQLSVQVQVFRLRFRSGLEFLPELLSCIEQLYPPTLTHEHA